ncbi:MAG: serine hydrolase, partial [Anaerolineales bacterium]
MRRRATGVSVLLLAVTMMVGPVRAQPLTPVAALERLCTAERLQADWFAPTFLGAVPLTAVEGVIAELRGEFGRCLRVATPPENFALIFERGIAVVLIRLDEQGRITALFFRHYIARLVSVEAAIATLRGFPGKTSLLLLEDGSEIAAVQPDTSLAIGSTFKLSVLAALKAETAAGRRSWSETVRLRPEWKSLPSGILQNSPDGTAVTLQRLAELMISISDNTATDALIHILGRPLVEAVAPPRNRPFLTTREAFVLKDPANRDLLDRYRGGSEAARRMVLEEVARRPLPGVGTFSGQPAAPDVEWFYSARELCAALTAVADLPLMGINSGPARASDWTRVAYKGGSEPGVLNLSSLVQH